ncbi:UTP4, partial [Symbiodinium sp. KB8]
MSSKPSTAVAVHRARFLDFRPRRVTCLAASPSSKLLAVSYSNAEVAVFRILDSSHIVPVLVRTHGGGRCLAEIVACGSSAASVTTIAWMADVSSSGTKDEFSDRCFVGGLTGHISEVDFTKSAYKNKLHSYGGAVWRLAAAPHHGLLAAASDDGRVNIHTTEGGAITWQRGLAGLGSRALCAAWHPTEAVVFAGSSSGVVCGWDLREGSPSFGRVAMRFTLPSPSAAPSLVWSLAVLADFTVATGDNYGQVTVWDGQSGTPVATMAHHKTDVYTLAAWEPGPDDGVAVGDVTAVLAAGSNDGKVSLISRQGQSWTVSEEHREHSHDVRGLALALAP